jgi:hypothetical protein
MFHAVILPGGTDIGGPMRGRRRPEKELTSPLGGLTVVAFERDADAMQG